jgi:hypothetical protein
MPDLKNESAGDEARSTHRAGRNPAKRQIAPWVLVIGGAFVFCLVLALVLGAIHLLRPAGQPVARGLQERTMPDGSILVLEKVTVGTSHNFEWQRNQSFSDWIKGIGMPRHTATAWAPGQAIVIWLSRRQAGTDQCLDFDWWLRCTALDDGGNEIEDDNAGRNSFSGGSSSGESAPRPFSPLSPGVFELIVAHSALLPFRHSGNSFKLRVYDTHDKVVAEFDVPHSSPAGLPVWRADPLPATKQLDEFEVTLKEIMLHPSEVTEGTRKLTRYSINPVLTITRDGLPTDDLGTREVTFEDPLGNTSSTWNPRLSLDESAWKMKIKLWPGDKVVPDPAHEMKVDHLLLAEAKTAITTRAKRTIDGAAVEFVAVGGTGKVVYTDLAPAGNANSSYAGNFGGENFLVEVRSDHGTATTTVDSKRPHLLARVTGLDPDQRLAVRVFDEEGRALPAQQIQMSDQVVVFFQPAGDAKTIDASFIVERAKKVEFFVKPPRRQTAPENDATKRLAP